MMKLKRKWLTPDVASFVTTQLDTEEWFKTADLTVSDGEKTVRFYLELQTNKNRKASIKQLTILQDAIRELVLEIGEIKEDVND